MFYVFKNSKRFEGLWKYWILNSKKGTVLSNTELNPFL